MYDTNGYLGFTFAGRHSSEFGLLVVSDGSRYHQNLSSDFSDSIVNVPGKSGGYFFGTQIEMRNFEINCVFYELTTHTRNKIQQWLYPNKIGWLVFDEMPYKKYLVKISGVPVFNFLPFDNYRKNGEYYFRNEILKGELSISFFSFEEYGVENENYELPNITKNELIDQQVIDSGLIPSNFNIGDLFLPRTTKNLTGNNKYFSIYNAGNGIAKADFNFFVTKSNFDNFIEFINYDDSQSYIINNFTQEFTSSYNKFKVEILGTKQEIWAYGVDDYNKVVQSTKLNIGNYYNHFYPKVYHLKPTEVVIAVQSFEGSEAGYPEPIFYPFTNEDKYLLSSDSKKSIHSFDEFDKRWSDYVLCTESSFFEVKDIVGIGENLVFNLNDSIQQDENETLLYLLYPNRFFVNTNIENFTPVYEHTYI